jgi:hypothetical protein
MREKDAEAAEPGEEEIFKPRLELGSLVICHFAAVNRNVGGSSLRDASGNVNEQFIRPNRSIVTGLFWIFPRPRSDS